MLYRASPALHGGSGTPGGGGYLSISGLSKSFGLVPVLKAFDLDVAPGEFVTLLGPSGCGKTTLLRLLAGLLSPDSGRITIGGRDITRVPTHRRNIGMVFQSYALFPHMTVAENVGFGLVARKEPKADVVRKTAAALDLVQLGHMADRPVTMLSGGQQQRVSVARALVVEPALILFDEPFSALDKKLRETMQVELKSILRRSGATAIFVTHDQEEALVLSDRIVVMNAGHVEQVDPPARVYGAPRTQFVLDFLGQASKISGRVKSSANGVTAVETAYGDIAAAADATPGERVIVAVRPEHIHLEAGEERDNSVTRDIADIIFLGGRTMVSFAADGSDRLLAEIKGQPGTLRSGAPACLSWSSGHTLLFPVEDRRG